MAVGGYPASRMSQLISLNPNNNQVPDCLNHAAQLPVNIYDHALAALLVDVPINCHGLIRGS
jgi:hypothetical protein